MRLFIPTIGTRIVLAADWSFYLHDEYRNEKFWMAMHGELKAPDQVYTDAKTLSAAYYNRKKAEKILTTLPAGSVIEVDRLYLKKGNGDFDSVTFRLVGGPIGKKVGRFWVKLDEVNEIIFDAEQSKKEIKYPNGRFVVSINERQENRAEQNCRCGYYHAARFYQRDNRPERCTCDQTQWPRKITNGLHWQQFPEKSGSWKGVSVNHEQHSIPGLLSQIKVGKHFHVESYHWGGNSSYRKDFATMEEMIIWSQRKGFTREHVEKFVESFKNYSTAPVVEQD